MKLTIKTTNLSLTPAIKRAIEKKIAVLDKFILPIDASVEAFIEVSVETRHHKKGKIYYAEANIKVPGKIIRSEAREENIYQAINTIKDGLQVMLKKRKEKTLQRRKEKVLT